MVVEGAIDNVCRTTEDRSNGYGIPNMTLDDFRSSLTAADPPAELTLALAGLWWDAKGIGIGLMNRLSRTKVLRDRGFTPTFAKTQRAFNGIGRQWRSHRHVSALGIQSERANRLVSDNNLR